VVIPGWRDYQERPPESILDLVRRAQANGSRLVSLCGGAFVLAEAGVLDGRRVATHWMFVEELRRRYSKIEVDQEALYIDEGDVLTSAGSAAGIDLCLHIVRKDYGSIIANHVAKRLLAQPYRDGGQSQFIEAPVPTARTGSLAEIMDWMTANLNTHITLPKLAKRARMSERSFYRHFKMTTGLSPKDWLIKERIRQAKCLLEGSKRDIDDIAAACGFGSPEALRYQFRRLVKTSPKAYQNAFRGVPGT
jgi:AraC family transcriptional activator FtrA